MYAVDEDDARSKWGVVEKRRNGGSAAPSETESVFEGRACVGCESCARGRGTGGTLAAGCGGQSVDILSKDSLALQVRFV